MRSTPTAARGLAAHRPLALVTVLVAVCGVAFAKGALAQPAGGSQAASKPAAAGDKTAAGSAAAPAAGAPAAGTPAAGTATPAAGTAPANPAPAGTQPAEGSAENTADVPVNLRLRQLEQRVQALKERAWRAKARVEMLKEAVLGGGVGARATIQFANKMGNSYRLIQLAASLDGTTIFTRKDDSGAMQDHKSFDLLSGPLTPGSHTLSILAIYRGNGYGVFNYLKKYKFTVRSSHTFTVDEGKGISIKVVGFERGGATTPLEDRPALDFQVNTTKE